MPPIQSATLARRLRLGNSVGSGSVDSVIPRGNHGRRRVPRDATTRTRTRTKTTTGVARHGRRRPGLGPVVGSGESAGESWGSTDRGRGRAVSSPASGRILIASRPASRTSGRRRGRWRFVDQGRSLGTDRGRGRAVSPSASDRISESSRAIVRHARAEQCAWTDSDLVLCLRGGAARHVAAMEVFSFPCYHTRVS